MFQTVRIPRFFAGALGALPAWTETMLALRPTSFDPAPPEGVAPGYVDFETGRPSAAGCPGTPVPVAVAGGPGATIVDGCEAAAHPAAGAQSPP